MKEEISEEEDEDGEEDFARKIMKDKMNGKLMMNGNETDENASEKDEEEQVS